MKRKIQTFSIVVVFLVLLFPVGQGVLAQDNQSVVRAVLFFSSTCPHCEKVIVEDLPPLNKKYGDQLQILGVNTSLPDGQALYQAAIDYYEIPQERRGVPTLIVGNTVLVGSGEIPEYFSGIIEEGLASGGVEWPEIPNLDIAIAASEFAEGAETGTSLNTDLTMTERFMLDPTGNMISVIVLIGMLLVVGMVVANFKHPADKKKQFHRWLIPALALAGISVASYLAFVEVSQTDAVCGPVGDCNTVQQSPYATLFGFLPVGVMGVIGYILIMFAWGIQHYGKQEWRRFAIIALWGMATFGTLFSIYLTFLEPFMIGATCMWCITSSVIQTTIFWIATEPAKEYIKISEGKISIQEKRKRRRTHKKKRS